MISSTSSEINDIIDRIFVQDLGGRASVTEVRDRVKAVLPTHLIDSLIYSGLTSRIQTYFRRKSQDGLPAAPEANADGEHVQLDLLSVLEYKFVYDRQIANGEAAYAQAEKYADRCKAIHGVDILDQAATA